MHYVIGDVHGCYIQLLKLLEIIKFDKKDDILIFAGDIINRGANSLKVIRFIQSLNSSARVILGNHELYLLYLLNKGITNLKNNTSLNDILNSKNKLLIMEWLQQQKFLLKIKKYFIVHAGIPHIWNDKQAEVYAKKLEYVLNSDSFSFFIETLYNTNIIKSSKNFTEVNQWCIMAQYFTMMRFCDEIGKLSLKYKQEYKLNKFYPWFKHKNNARKNKIIFGHWSAIKGITDDNNFIALDTGCIWGNKLSAFCIENKKFYRIQC